MADIRDFSISPSSLSEIFKNRDSKIQNSLESLKAYGGIEGLCHQLQTDLCNGIDDSPTKISKRVNHFGTNKFEPKVQRASFFECLKDQLTDYTLLLILFLSSVSIIIGVFAGTTEYIGNFKVLVSVWILNAIYAVFNYKKAKNLSTLKAPNWKVKVIRAGVEKEISKNDLLTGDLLIVSKGDVLQVDGILIKGSILDIKERENLHLSNEISPLESKNPSNPFIYFNSKILEGNGVVLVCAVGKYTSKPQSIPEPSDEEETLIETKIEEKAESWGKIGLISSIIIIFVLLIIFFYHSIVAWKWGAAGTIEVLSIFVTGLALIIVSIPENFTVFVSTYFCHTTKQIEKDNIFIKNVSQIELIGEVTTVIISSNKESAKSLCNLMQNFENSGIAVIIVTEEDVKTGKEICENCGITDDFIMDIEILKKRVPGLISILDSNKEDPKVEYIIKSFKKAAENVKVFANCAPNDKIIIKQALQASGEVIASIEACQTDSSLLEISDVGIFTPSNSQICMAASTIFLPDTNYEAFIHFLRRGRNLVLSTQKLIVHREASIFVLLFICLIGVFTSGKLLFNGVQLIWMCFLLDILGTLVFTINYDGDSETKPFKREDEIVNGNMKILIRAQILYQALVLVFLYFGSQSSLIFHTFIFLQIFNELSLVNWSFKNFNAIAVVALSFIMHYFAIEYAGSWLDCEKMSWEGHFNCIKLAAGSLAALFIAKLLFKFGEKK
ncbi:unnamed protein product [Blepharisma stoltei]|uniref:Cation-transporting P-type ATPase N-terminal domain-containing protein n=1 Tax=Blepharisma stoltei TaxID=1481888 RepID=A0AAU9IZJ3_9CILI|nr:unnamed protein product [Blepharisma stoltei]